MPYTIVYLQYTENRNTDSNYDDEDLDDRVIDEDDPEFDFDESQDRVFVEFNPIKLSVREPRGEYIEIELDFETKVGDTLHLVVVRYNNHRSGVLEDWCVEKVFQNGDEAEELVENMEDGLSGAECSENKDHDSIVVKSEVFSMAVSK
jgi:hypothetical protein